MIRIIDNDGNVIPRNTIEGWSTLFFIDVMPYVKSGEYHVQRYRKKKWVTIPLKWLTKVPMGSHKRNRREPHQERRKKRH